MYKASEYATRQGNYETKSLFATGDTMTYGGQNQDGKNIYDAITSLKGKSKYENKFEIIEGELFYIGTNSKEKEWAPTSGVGVLSDEPTINITALNTLPIKAGVNSTYSLGISCGLPMNTPTFNNTNVKVLNSLGAELGTQPTISGVVSGTENKKTAEITINTTGMPEGVYKIKVLANAVQTSTTGNEETLATGTFEIDNTAPTMPSINITPSTPTSGDVTVTLGGKPDNTYKLEYSTDGTNWSVYTTSLTVTSNLTIYARITDAANNTSNEATLAITNIDKTVPGNATLSVSTSGDKVTGTLTLTDSDTGIELTESKYIVTTQSTTYAVDAAEWNSATVFTVNPQTISVTKTNGDYYVQTLSTDKAGNKRVNISTKVTVSSVSYGVNAPILAAGMTAKKWNTTTSTWDTVSNPSTDTSWYSYTNTDKKWANAQTADGSMWVWIPRYEYKITTPHSNTAQTIAVNFISGTSSTVTSGYTMHPAFTFGTEITGIWVAKFEASGTTSSVDLKPGVTSLRNTTIDAMFTACRNMETNTAKYGWTTTDLDTHLMRNVEWGAAAYLSSSIYGKSGEVDINNDTSYTTGGGATTAYTTNITQSTTGNIYGIYDMSGGAYEYTAAYVNNGNSALTTNGSSVVGSLSKYQDLYTMGTGDTEIVNYNANPGKKGDAFYETSSNTTGSYSWYEDQTFTPYLNWPFFMRGGNRSVGTGAGVFAFTNYSGGARSDCGFRPVVVMGSGL